MLLPLCGMMWLEGLFLVSDGWPNLQNGHIGLTLHNIHLIQITDIYIYIHACSNLIFLQTYMLK